MVEWLSNALDMRFYYWTGLSWLILLPTYIIGAGLITLLWWWLAKRMKRSWVAIVLLYAVLAIAPWVEELWIAWNFGQLCKKGAGIFVFKSVEVEGFYHGSGAPFDLVRSGRYRWIEGPSPDGKGANRLTLGDMNFSRQAKDRLDRVKGLTIPPGAYRVDMDATTEALIFTTTGETWRITKLDQPTARYQYRGNRYGIDVTHGVQKFENVVVDTQSDEVLGRYLIYYRDAPWFFIGLDRPTIPCAETERDTRKYGTISVDALVFGHGPKGSNGGQKK